MKLIIKSIKKEYKALTYPSTGTLTKTTTAVIVASIFLSVIIFLETAGVEKLIYLIMKLF